MSDILTFQFEETIPDRNAVLGNQGIPVGEAVSPSIETLCARAFEVFAAWAAPAGMLRELSKQEFEVVYRGEGQNESATPVGDIYARADALALFAVTLGQTVSRKIEECFRSNDFALGAMLDCTASAAADKLARVAETRFYDILAQRGEAQEGTCVLSYCPGYCGWHISGQKKLFETLRPEKIDISLRESCLMEPLKSVSGVLIAGPRGLHDFDESYTACGQCETHGCRDRILGLSAERK